MPPVDWGKGRRAGGRRGGCPSSQSNARTRTPGRLKKHRRLEPRRSDQNREPKPKVEMTRASRNQDMGQDQDKDLSSGTHLFSEVGSDIGQKRVPNGHCPRVEAVGLAVERGVDDGVVQLVGGGGGVGRMRHLKAGSGWGHAGWACGLVAAAP